MDVSMIKLWETVKARKAWHAAIYGVAELDMTERPNNSERLGRMWWEGDGFGMILIRNEQPRALTCVVHSRDHAPMRI